ncbi:hypothetical protein BGE01nite_47600 [Brevifollis gellanilyticus]|uniref:Uncharacterized protein n=2 Tax=Brevifollis gellanilyticus TaxID=748831 RepID=A0A512MFE3_9BACT|nr:hypothetical protein BGE01nite_47600 [Brevifollis gellanilyticus]
MDKIYSDNFNTFLNFVMHIRFLSDGSEFRSYGGGNFSKKKEGNGGIFWWAILITLLMGAATFSWFFSIMVFQHPEKPFNYKMLAKFNKLEPLRPFTTFTVPNGKKVNARELLTEFYPYSAEQMAVKNDVLKRSFIRNYKHEKPLYVVGNYKVLSLRMLTDKDVVSEGWVVRARATDLEDVDVEIIMPGLTVKDEPFRVGDVVAIDGNKPQVTALHVQRMDGDRICVTTMPLAYTNFTNATATLKMTPPELLNMDAYWPVTRDTGSAMAAETSELADGTEVAAKN